MLYESMGIYRCPLILEMLDFQRGYPLMTDIVKAIILGIIGFNRIFTGIVYWTFNFGRPFAKL